MAQIQTLTARDLMTTDVETVSVDDDVSEVLSRLARADFNGYPVVDEDGSLAGIVTQHDLVGLFQTQDRTLWIPVGFPPFLETLTYAVDVSWDDLDLGIDLLRNTNKPISGVMTSDVVTVEPDASIDEILDLLADEERDINRLPVLDDGELVGIVARQDVIRAIRDERRATEAGADESGTE
ncbi:MULTISPECIES: CBS domain-containing protein [Halobellus]|uniref:CBS domain-containing protein n=1 Tax=Halobellus TaxID=1073986 RepID=UPI0021138EAF|nr:MULTISPECIES: CBS domain-containing protein [Halobellus]MDQ2054734.1 CBS domain-containing protein [Halobellus sp. H-GB7]